MSYLANLNPQETEQATRLLQRLDKWLEDLPPEDVKNNQYNAALDSVNKAILETRKYLKQRREGGERDAETEERLSKLWSDASSEIRPYDAKLADLCMVKGHGWADDTVWSDPKYKQLPIDIDEMLQHLRDLSKHHPPAVSDKQKKFEQYLAYGFGVLFIIVILILAIVFPTPTKFQYTVFRIVLALAAAGIAAVIPGFLQVEVSTMVRAGGAIAVFVIVFFFSPAQLAVEQVPNTEAIHLTVGEDQPFEQIVKKVEISQHVIITFYENCQTVRNAVVEAKGRQLDGDNIKDFLEKLRNRIRDNSRINYVVKEIAKGERYEIDCR